MKKYILSLGTIGAVVAPIATVIACGSSKKELKVDLVRQNLTAAQRADLETKLANAIAGSTALTFTDDVKMSFDANFGITKIVYTVATAGEVNGTGIEGGHKAGDPAREMPESFSIIQTEKISVVVQLSDSKSLPDGKFEVLKGEPALSKEEPSV